MVTVKLLSLFAEHPYPVLFLWVFCEQMGCPIPSAPLLIAAGALCVVSCGTWILTFVTVIVACLLADLIWFQLGRTRGDRLISLLLRFSLMSPASLAKTSEKLAKYNGLALILAKFVPGMSTLAPPLSGHSGMNRSRFILWDLAGSSLWAFSWLAGGRLLLRMFKASGHYIRLESGTGIRIVLFLIVAIIIWRIALQIQFLAFLHKRRVTPQGLLAMISLAKANAGIPPYVIDLRAAQDVALDPRRIPNAVRVEPECLESRHHAIPRDREVILYCSCPSAATSTLWAFRLRRLGIVKVHLLRGGMKAWLDAGYDLTPNQAAATA